MFSSFWGAAATLALSLFSSTIPVSGLGSSCSAPLGSGSAAPSDPYWQQTITHQGTSPYGPSGYQVFRNVKDFGAKGELKLFSVFLHRLNVSKLGDGVTDDTAAIKCVFGLFYEPWECGANQTSLQFGSLQRWSLWAGLHYV